MPRSRYNLITVAIALITLIAASALLGLPYWRERFTLPDPPPTTAPQSQPPGAEKGRMLPAPADR